MENYKVTVRRKCEHDEEMYHAKYIKREMVNGKWRYYYNYNDLKDRSNKAGTEASTYTTGTSAARSKTKKATYSDIKSVRQGVAGKIENGVRAVTTLTQRSVKSFSTKVINSGKTVIQKMINGNNTSNRPVGRKKNVTNTTGQVRKRGSGIGSTVSQRKGRR